MSGLPVDALTAAEFGLSLPLSPALIERHQMARLQAALTRAMHASPFYHRHLAGIDPEQLTTRADLTRLPLLDAKHLSQAGQDLVCVSQTDVQRIVTLNTSGSTGPAKRLFFTESDLVATKKFFQQGMHCLIGRDDRVLILLPGNPANAVGDLLQQALAADDIAAACIWPIPETADLAALIEQRGFTSLVGLPQHLLALAHQIQPGTVRSMLLCSDYAAPALRLRIEQLTGARTFLHWGSTETGLGGGVECQVHNGCHLRDSQLLVEIIDPDSAVSLPDGAEGEVVVTTLTRQAMPLFRYRTGDIATLTREPCGCGAVGSRLQFLRGRRRAPLIPGDDGLLSQQLDNLLYSVAGLLDYRIIFEDGPPDRLSLTYLAAPDAPDLRPLLDKTLRAAPALRRSLTNRWLALGSITAVRGFPIDHTTKRSIIDRRQTEALCV